jgi:hypothetical protein
MHRYWQTLGHENRTTGKKHHVVQPCLKKQPIRTEKKPLARGVFDTPATGFCKAQSTLFKVPLKPKGRVEAKITFLSL